MPRRLIFSPNAWNDYVYWQSQDSKTLARINKLIQDCQRDPFKGVGKPEPLRGNFAGCWSRRIDDTHRLVYRTHVADLEIIACRFHYDEH